MIKDEDKKEDTFNGISLLAFAGLGVLIGLLLKGLIDYRDDLRDTARTYSKQPLRKGAKPAENVKAIAKKRRLEILNFVKLKGSVSSSELKNHFKGIHERTLRRDLAWLENEGLLLQKGTTRDSRYFIKN